jgi:hypothetical protein
MSIKNVHYDNEIFEAIKNKNIIEIENLLRYDPNWKYRKINIVGDERVLNVITPKEDDRVIMTPTSTLKIGISTSTLIGQIESYYPIEYAIKCFDQSSRVQDLHVITAIIENNGAIMSFESIDWPDISPLCRFVEHPCFHIYEHFDRGYDEIFQILVKNTDCIETLIKALKCIEHFIIIQQRISSIEVASSIARIELEKRRKNIIHCARNAFLPIIENKINLFISARDA